MIGFLDVVAFATELSYYDQTVGNSSELMPGFFVDEVFGDYWRNTGFYAVAFSSRDCDDVILAIRGSQDRFDFVANCNLGIGQYTPHRSALIDYVGSRLLGHRVIIAGHSLGGGLSQYLSYDLGRNFPGFREQITVQTHNGLGGVTGIGRMHGACVPEVIAGITYRNYRHPDDPVSRIGGQLGGNIMLLDDPNPLQDGMLYAHANARFLPVNGCSSLERASPCVDKQFNIEKTLTELGPFVGEALDRLLDERQVLQCLTEIYTLLRQVPQAERPEFAELIHDVLPFRRLWRNTLRRLTVRKLGHRV